MTGSTLVVLFSRPLDDPRAKSRLKESSGLPAPLIQDLHNAFVHDSSEILKKLTCDYLYCWSDENYQSLDDAPAIVQKGTNFLERFENFLAEPLVHTYDTCIIIGSDTPYLTLDVLQAAVEAFEDNDYCLGPARAGGIYLLGGPVSELSRMPWKQIFSHWNQPSAFLSATGGGTSLLLPVLDDIDTADDLLHLMMLFALHIDFSIAPKTRGVLARVRPVVSTENNRRIHFELQN